MAGELLLDEPADGVLRLTISNPAKRNALDHAILDAIAAALRRHRRRARGPAHRRRAGCSPRATTSATSPSDVFAEEAERLVAHPFTAAIDALETLPTSRRSPRCRATPSAAASSWRSRATCASPPTAILLGMPPAKLGLVYSHTGLRRFLEAIGAPRTRELFLTRPQRRRAHGAGLGARQPGRRRRRPRRARRCDLAAGPRRQRPAVACAATSACIRELLAAEGAARPRRRARAHRAARGELPVRGPARGRARVRPRSAPRAGRAAEPDARRALAASLSRAAARYRCDQGLDVVGSSPRRRARPDRARPAPCARRPKPLRATTARLAAALEHGRDGVHAVERSAS